MLIQHFSKIVRLFSSLKSRTSREAIASIISSTSKATRIEGASFCHYLDLLIELESWDAQRINEPDSTRRHMAFVSLLQVSF